MITLTTLAKLPQKKKQRVGRGEGSHRGKNAGKGHKGQKKRNPSSIRVDFEGGQSRLTKRTPKYKGFTSRKNIYTAELPISALEVFEDGTNITFESLKEMNLIDSKSHQVRIVLKGALTKKLVIEDPKIYLTKGAKSILS